MIKKIKLNLYRNALKKSIKIGWKICMIGVFHARFGLDTEFLFGTRKMALTRR